MERTISFSMCSKSSETQIVQATKLSVPNQRVNVRPTIKSLAKNSARRIMEMKWKRWIKIFTEYLKDLYTPCKKDASLWKREKF